MTERRFLISLGIEGFKRIQAAYVEFGEHAGMTLVTGRNAQGKSTVLDAIMAAIGGKSAMPANPIHDGMEQGRIRAKLGELVVTRTFNRADDGKITTKVVVEAADGARYGSPQEMMDDLFGTFTFNPLRWLSMSEKDQYDALKAHVSGVDFELMERLQTGETERRRDHNREVKRLTALAEGIAYPPDTPSQPISIERLSKALEKAGDANATRERIIAGKEALRKTISQLTIENERLKALIVANMAQIEEAADRFDGTVVPEEIDTAALRKELTTANATNKDVAKLRERRDYEAMLKSEQAKADALTKSMTDRAEEVRKAIAETAMPIEGLSLAQGGVTYLGQPFKQASQAEQLRCSIAIAMAENPNLRTILVREGGLMDSSSLKIVADMAEERGFQVIVERVDESGKIGIVMEDGMVASTPESRETGTPPSAGPASDATAKRKQGRKGGA